MRALQVEHHDPVSRACFRCKNMALTTPPLSSLDITVSRKKHLAVAVESLDLKTKLHVMKSEGAVVKVAKVVLLHVLQLPLTR